MDERVRELYIRLLSGDSEVDGCFNNHNGTYTITLSKPSYWPYDDPGARTTSAISLGEC